MLRKLLITCLAASLLVTGCGKDADEKANSNKATTGFKPVKLGVLPIEDNFPFYVAQASGLFKEAGLKVELIPFDSARERDIAMQAGQIDGEVADLVAVSLLKKGGTDVRVATIGLGVTPEEGRFVLLASPQSTVNSLSDLKNVPVAISENSIIEYVTDNILVTGGLGADEMKKVAIPSIPARLEALLSGQIQAAVLPDPLATLAAKQGARVITDDTNVNLSQTVLLFRKKTIDDNRAAVAKVVEIYGKAGQELTSNPTKYRDLFIEKARVPAPIKNTYRVPTFSPLQAPTEEDVTKIMDWMLDKHLLIKAFSYDEIVDSSLIFGY